MLRYYHSDSKCKIITIILFIGILSAYSVGIGIYECFTGGIAANLVIEYYDYSMQVNGTDVRIAIDALPRDVYKNTKNLAGILIFFGAAGIICTIGALIYGAYLRSKSNALYGSILSNIIIILVPFCYTAFLTAKLHTIDNDDVEFWNSIDKEFIRGYYRAQNIMIATIVPGVVWFIIICGLVLSGELD